MAVCFANFLPCYFTNFCLSQGNLNPRNYRNSRVFLLKFKILLNLKMFLLNSRFWKLCCAANLEKKPADNRIIWFKAFEWLLRNFWQLDNGEKTFHIELRLPCEMHQKYVLKVSLHFVWGHLLRKQRWNISKKSFCQLKFTKGNLILFR